MLEAKKVLTLVAAIVVLAFAYYAGSAAPVVSDRNYTYIAEMKWHNTYDAGAREAMQTNKPMVVYFWTIWCTYCEKYHREVFSREDIREILAKDFVRVAVDMDTNREDTNRFNVRAPPHLIFMTSSGEIVRHVPGYVPPEEFKSVLLGVLPPTGRAEG